MADEASRRNRRAAAVKKPDVFKYHEYREYLKDWLAYRKAGQSGYSLSSLARESGLTTAFLSMVLNGKRPLTRAALIKLCPSLKMSQSERSFLDQLVLLGSSDSQEQRLEALAQMKRYRAYQRCNPKETEVYHYLTHWYYVAIREMSALPDFQTEAEWIQSRLRAPVDLKEIRNALSFLIENGFIERTSTGEIRPPDRTLDCLGGVYRVALTQFHREMLNLAGKAIETTPSEERLLLGHGIAFDEENYRMANSILSEAFEKIRKLKPEPKKCKSVYWMHLTLFPLTKKREQQS